MTQLDTLATDLANARIRAAASFRATDAARKVLADAEREQLEATFKVQELESALLAYMRNEVGPIPQRKTLELRNARYTKSDARV